MASIFTRKKTRYAVVGLGHIAQAAVLPAFESTKHTELTALVSGDNEKLQKLGHKYKVKNLYSYKQYDQCLESGEVDAVYIALPNSMHREFTIRAARKGIHILCEKPMAITERECAEMTGAAIKNKVKLMVAYRLHLEKANLSVVDLVYSGEIGEVRAFSSVFSMQVSEGNIRTQKKLGGGPLYDIGIYCINAARYIFRDEPYEVYATAAKSADRRFREVDEMCSCVLRYPKDRIANFTVSFGLDATARYEVLGTKGNIVVEPAYEWQEGLGYKLTANGRTKEKRFPATDQFAAELEYFSNCVQKDEDPEPSGVEGLADVRIIEALHASIKLNRPIQLIPTRKLGRPSAKMQLSLGRVKAGAPLVKVQSPHH